MCPDDTTPTQKSKPVQPPRRLSIVSSQDVLASTELDLLGRWFEICNNYTHLHYLSFEYYRKINYMLMIPIITITTGSGSFNLASSFYPTVFSVQLTLGILGLLTGMISSIYSFMEIPQLQEQHNMYSNHFEKFARSIEMELVLCKNKSKTYSSLGEFIKIIKSEIDRLIDNGPFIPIHILEKSSIENSNSDVSKCEKSRSLDEQINSWEISKRRTSSDLNEEHSRSHLKEIFLQSV